MSIHSMNATTFAKVACTSYCCQQLTFYMYHCNSYASNPILLRSPKPMVMRDFFLIRGSPREVWHIPNPLSSLYVLTFKDALWNCMAAWAVGFRLVETVGFRHVLMVYVLGSIFSSFAYVFQMQCSKTKKKTEFDCASMSTGAMSALCSLSLLLPPAAMPWTRRTPTTIFSLIFLSKALLEEYGPSVFRDAVEVGPTFRFDNASRLHQGTDTADVKEIYSPDESSTDGVPARGAHAHNIQLNNWGGVGGIFLGLIYGTLVLRTKTDLKQIRRFWSNMPKGNGNACQSSDIPPSWANPAGSQQRM